MKNLPVGISEFSELRERNCLYIDKTKYVYSLLTKNRRTFLSRPRRFWKSLFVSTLEAALLGNKELFKESWIENSDYDWAPYGVIRLDFSALSIESEKEFKESLMDVLLEIAEAQKIFIEKTQNMNVLFSRLIGGLLKKFNSVAILIDEYDYPILHTLHDPKLVRKIREIVKSLSTCIKAKQKQIKFVFVTGVSALQNQVFLPD